MAPRREPDSVVGRITQSTKGQKVYYSTPNPFELRFGYYRAVRRGSFIFVSGTTALKFQNSSSSLSSPENVGKPVVGGAGAGEAKGEEGGNDEAKREQSKVLYPTDGGKQATVAMERCIDAVERLGGTVADIVRVRMYVSRHEDCLVIGEAFRRCFSAAATVDKNLEQLTEDVKEEEGGGGSGIGAAATMVVVENGFVDPGVLVELEVDAVVL